MKTHYILLLFAFLIIISGCSNNDPVFPVDGLSRSVSLPDDIGILGRYDLTVETSTLTAELTPKRITSLGESFMVSGLEYFNSAPCSTCLTLMSVGIDPMTGDFVLFFLLEHPFDVGDPGQPPSGVNRLDLDIFDPALVIRDVAGFSPTYFPLHDTDISSIYVTNAAGYTTELANLTQDPAPAPYVLVMDDSTSGQPATNNMFPMGASFGFTAMLGLQLGEILNFELFLTFGYGASATFEERLNPQYFTPEFNRKAAWKVEVEGPPLTDPWQDQDDITLKNVTVTVYDWQAGADVNPALENPWEVFAASEVLTVSAEVPGMTATLPMTSVPDSGSGRPQDPFIFTVSFANENKLGAGYYIGLVKVTDSRTPLTELDGRDFLIDTRDGIQRDHYVMNEYATYQIFETYIAVI